MWYGDMTVEQVELIERTFATLTEHGWTIPQWVISLREKVERRWAEAAEVDL